MAMIPRVAELYDRLGEQKALFVDTLEALSAEQLNFRAKPEAWNVVQVGHHVVIAEQRTADSIKKHRGMRSGKRRLHHTGRLHVALGGAQDRNSGQEPGS